MNINWIEVIICVGVCCPICVTVCTLVDILRERYKRRE